MKQQELHGNTQRSTSTLLTLIIIRVMISSLESVIEKHDLTKKPPEITGSYVCIFTKVFNYFCPVSYQKDSTTSPKNNTLQK